MKRILICAALALALPGCKTSALLSAGTQVADAAGAPPPAVIASKTIADEKALTIAAGLLNATAQTTSALVHAGVIQPGSPRALSIAAKLELARDLINTAAAARTSVSYSDALAKLTPLVAEIQADLKE